MNPENGTSVTDLVPAMPTLTVEAMPDDAPEWAHVLYRQQVQIMDVMDRTATLIEGGVSQVAPLVDSLSSSPIFRMMGGGRNGR